MIDLLTSLDEGYTKSLEQVEMLEKLLLNAKRESKRMRDLLTKTNISKYSGELEPTIVKNEVCEYTREQFKEIEEKGQDSYGIVMSSDEMVEKLASAVENDNAPIIVRHAYEAYGSYAQGGHFDMETFFDFVSYLYHDDNVWHYTLTYETGRTSDCKVRIFSSHDYQDLADFHQFMLTKMPSQIEVMDAYGLVYDDEKERPMYCNLFHTLQPNAPC